MGIPIIAQLKQQGGLVGFGRLFMSKISHLFLDMFPNLPFRLLMDIALERGDQEKWCMHGNYTPAGYPDWPFAPENGQVCKCWF
ncbi:hypothetical protein P692DRAFT_20723411 [Suillus brevipes Sb2]|nr:hypothetical protein P692DRAFT_20723411 [Suillus brevipes Sb2]